MFDAVEIGRRISRLRKERDMTQPALADVMGVSFQAVSNWERGVSMPDIGKLPELAQALGVSVDELLGGGRGGELIRSVIDGSEETFVKNERITLSEAGEAAPLLKPKQVTRIVRAIDEGKDQRDATAGRESSDSTEQSKIDLESLVAIAPFLDEDYLDELAGRLAPNIGLGKLASLAPFVSEDALGKLALASINTGGTLGELAAIAPFLDEGDLGKIALSCVENGGSISQLASIAPFLDEDDLDCIVRTTLKQGQKIGDLSALFPFLSHDTLRALVEDALKNNDTGSLSKISMFL
jgi:transcriptional regulator with XRE-family HTH domain